MEQKTKPESRNEERVVRILSRDIEGRMKVYPALTKIKGISWSIANAVCKILGIDKARKIGSLTDDEIKKLSEFMKNPKIPKHINNRRFDFETGKDKHIIGTELELQHDLDIKRLKKIRRPIGPRRLRLFPSARPR